MSTRRQTAADRGEIIGTACLLILSLMILAMSLGRAWAFTRGAL